MFNLSSVNNSNQPLCTFCWLMEHWFRNQPSDGLHEPAGLLQIHYVHDKLASQSEYSNLTSCRTTLKKNDHPHYNRPLFVYQVVTTSRSSVFLFFNWTSIINMSRLSDLQSIFAILLRLYRDFQFYPLSHFLHKKLSIAIASDYATWLWIFTLNKNQYWNFETDRPSKY